MKGDAEWVMGQHEFASGLYAGANKLADEVETLFKADYAIDKDNADHKSPSDVQPARPARARAILEKYLTLLGARAKFQLSVIPKNTSEQELRACSKIEHALRGYRRATKWQTRKDFERQFKYWFFLRGRACVETRFDASYLGGDTLPFRTIVDDPKCVFSVWGRDGILWYTKEYQRYARDLKAEIDRRKNGDKKNKWRLPDLPDDENEMVKVIEYWDGEHCAAVVGDKLLYQNEHNYGFVPISEAHCMDTPLTDNQWAYQSVLAPIMDSLKKMYVLVSKLATSTDLHYYPTILVQFEGGGIQAYDGRTFSASEIPQGVKSVQVINPTSNAQLLQLLLGWFQGDVSLGGIPEIAWGVEPSSLTSGFAVSQVLTQIMDKIYDKKESLELGLGWHFGHLLKLVEHFRPATGANFRVPGNYQYAELDGRKQKVSTFIDLTPEDIDGRCYVEATLTPQMEQGRLAAAQLAQAYRAPGSDGRPVMDDLTILEEIIQAEYPDLIKQRIDQQLLPALSEEVKNVSLAAAEQKWMDENPDRVKLAQKRMIGGNTKGPLSPEQIMQMVDYLTKQLPPPTVPEIGAMPGAMPQPGMPGTDGGFLPNVIPPQMQGMAPEDAIPQLETLEQSQPRRAYSPPAPEGAPNA